MTKQKQVSDAATFLLEEWAKSQQQVMQVYLRALAGAGSKKTEAPWFAQTFEAARQAFEATQRNRVQWAHDYFQNMASNSGKNPAVTAWAKAMDDAVDEWAQAEQQCWQACLDSLDPTTASKASKACDSMQTFWGAYAGAMQTWLAMPAAMASEMLKQSTATDKPAA